MGLDLSRMLGFLAQGDFRKVVEAARDGFPWIEHNTRSDGSVERMTIVSVTCRQFRFQGDWYGRYDLEAAEVLETYCDDSWCRRDLRRDRYGRLLLHGYDRDVDTENGGFREDEVFVLVDSAADAEVLSHEGRWGLLREPYVYIDETGRLVAHEMEK